MAEVSPMQKGTGKRLMWHLLTWVGRPGLGRHGMLHRHVMEEIGDRCHYHHQHQHCDQMWPCLHSFFHPSSAEADIIAGKHYSEPIPIPAVMIGESYSVSNAISNLMATTDVGVRPVDQKKSPDRHQADYQMRFPTAISH